MIFDKIIFARIDRLTGIINFNKRKNENETLNEWVGDVHKILGLVDSTAKKFIVNEGFIFTKNSKLRIDLRKSEIINREYEVHGVH